ncbi:hypothetical protein NF867_06765 [Solitalea sp. MAHUQ-68]|uniref:Uncharacterized protein n=1 Tax=Solitalea agri TaxID=2953739 RepID=A0A9X2JEM8_9SPHI|nr:hypothetical protein [Solitalea agri]MCO4292556.1 hypothetical protein [Solitalea agri]
MQRGANYSYSSILENRNSQLDDPKWDNSHLDVSSMEKSEELSKKFQVSFVRRSSLIAWVQLLLILLLAFSSKLLSKEEHEVLVGIYKEKQAISITVNKKAYNLISPVKKKPFFVQSYTAYGHTL